ncbi:GNAT family N-acetyltransferase [Oscillospiraceae bacterium NTUH-002-81]|nr:GNAT family N-acetyltransferase [Oscillospiraceae bacterium NTUH-002-81]
MQEGSETPLSHMPYLVCEIDGKIVGYAYASLYRSRAAYDWDCELSVYLEEDYHRGGIGKMLYRLLFALLEQMHYRHAYACITSPNPESIDFHAAMGFQHVAFFPGLRLQGRQMARHCMDGLRAGGQPGAAPSGDTHRTGGACLY